MVRCSVLALRTVLITVFRRDLYLDHNVRLVAKSIALSASLCALSRSIIHLIMSLFIQGLRLYFSLIDLKGACLSDSCKKAFFH